jgi:ketosteroid isomerase-like protein
MQLACAPGVVELALPSFAAGSASGTGPLGESMRIRWLLTGLLGLAMALSLTCTQNRQTQEVDVNAEKARIEQVIHSGIGWAQTKDTELMYSCYAHDEKLFWFTPEAGGTNNGFEDLRRTTEGFFLNPAFKAVRYEIRELEINLSRSGDVAWYHCYLDDENEWQGRPASWINVRWTGVLEKREGNWVIVQMHFSYGAGDKGNEGA